MVTREWLAFKILYPIPAFILFAIIVAVCIISLATPVGMIIITALVGWIITYMYLYVTVFFKIYKANMNMWSPYTWFCYILYAGFVPGGLYIVNYELKYDMHKHPK